MAEPNLKGARPKSSLRKIAKDSAPRAAACGGKAPGPIGMRSKTGGRSFQRALLQSDSGAAVEVERRWQVRRYEGVFLGGFGAQSQVVLCSALLCLSLVEPVPHGSYLELRPVGP